MDKGVTVGMYGWLELAVCLPPHCKEAKRCQYCAIDSRGTALLAQALYREAQEYAKKPVANAEVIMVFIQYSVSHKRVHDPVDLQR